jgi:hypothetical protein
MDDEVLNHYGRLSQSAGLVKVFDGSEWLDLRLVVKEIIAEARRQRERADDAESRLDIAIDELDRANNALDAAHAEVSLLGALLRDG